jgi:hypothetical protein
MPALLVQALVELGVQGIREIGPVLVTMIRGWFASLAVVLRSRGESEAALDELYAQAWRIVRNLETVAVPGAQKEAAARRVLLEWNEGRYRKRLCFHALATAVLALELGDEELA